MSHCQRRCLTPLEPIGARAGRNSKMPKLPDDVANVNEQRNAKSTKGSSMLLSVEWTESEPNEPHDLDNS